MADVAESGADGTVDGTSGDDDLSLGRKAAGGFVWALVGFALMQVGSFATYTIATKEMLPKLKANPYQYAEEDRKSVV